MKARIIRNQDDNEKKIRRVDLGAENPETCELSTLRNAIHVVLRESSRKTEPGNPFAPFEGVDGVVREIWYDNALSNCVAFAMHIDLKAKNTGWYIPGWISTHKIPKDYKEIMEYMISDLKALGRNVHQVIEGDIPEKLDRAPKGQYWMKCLCKKEQDIASMHWMCKDEDSGVWLHKVGWTAPPKIVERITKEISTREIVFERCPEAKKHPKMVELIAQTMGMKIDDFIPVEAVIEKQDNAGYTAYTENGKEIYIPMFVLLVDE